jgi:hydroxymethylglutaryl-CoA reductase
VTLSLKRTVEVTIIKNRQKAKDECVELLISGKLPPWKLEEELVSVYHVALPGNFVLAAESRREFIEKITGTKFSHIQIPEKPYKIHYFCPKDNLTFELDALDSHTQCPICGKKMENLGQFSPLVASYVGGCESYYSYAGRIRVKGDIEKEFTNLLIYGTGLGPIGVTRGCFYINTFGGACVRVDNLAQAVRCHGLTFDSDETRRRAKHVIEAHLNRIKDRMNDSMKEFKGIVSSVDFDLAESGEDFILYVDYVASFANFRGHGDISRAVGFIKGEIENLLDESGIHYKSSVIAQGHDGDLKPSSQNKRGRKVEAEVRVPIDEFEAFFKIDPEKFLSFVNLDALGAQKLGCAFYSGMGGEIIPAVYKATQVNPQSPLVSSFQNICAGLENGEVVYRVELPNVEVGVFSTREGIVSPSAREAMRIMGIHTAREFAASLAAQVLAGEFNLALEISRERLYSTKPG